MNTKLSYVFFLLLIGLGAFVIMPGTAFAGAPKVDVCHIPPDNPANFHTITVSETSVEKHLENHGDLLGSCSESCQALCDDGNACTQDVVSDTEQCICQPAPGPTVNCDDSNACTIDSCDPVIGCVNDTESADDMVCDDSDEGIIDGVCSGGICEPQSQFQCPCWMESDLNNVTTVNWDPLSSCDVGENSGQLIDLDGGGFSVFPGSCGSTYTGKFEPADGGDFSDEDLDLCAQQIEARCLVLEAE